MKCTVLNLTLLHLTYTISGRFWVFLRGPRLTNLLVSAFIVLSSISRKDEINDCFVLSGIDSVCFGLTHIAVEMVNTQLETVFITQVNIHRLYREARSTSGIDCTVLRP